jgi:predicted Zn-dependent protease
MGVQAFAQIKQEEKVSTNVMANDRVQRVGRRIAGAVGRSLPEAKWEFVVFESKDLNAFALPGGKVGVYTGILDLAETDDELAAVMGHEIAHVSSRHGAERMSQSTAVGILGAAVAIGTEDSSNQDAWRTAFGLGSTLGMLGYSRLHESEADAIGMGFAALAGYDPRGAITFWQKMMKANEGQARPPEWLSTHPSNETRIRNLEELAPNYMPVYEEAKRRIESGETWTGENEEAATREIGRP